MASGGPARISWSDLRVARRLLLAFILSVMFPLAILFPLAHQQIGAQLESQAEERLRSMTRATALVLLDRLLQERRELQRSAALGAKDLPASIRFFADPDDQGTDLPALDLPLRDHQALQTGDHLLRLVERQPVGIELITRASTPKGSVLVARTFDAHRLLDLTEHGVVPDGAAVCIHWEGRPLFCPERRLHDLRVPSRGSFRLASSDSQWIGHAHPLFLKAEFGVTNWTVVQAQDRASVMAPVMAFRRTFPLVAILALAAAALVGLRQIRAYAEPLRALREGTRRIAGQDFGSRVAISTGDEFEDLADSFNEMTARLHRQFESLSVLVDMDRTVLEAQDSERVVDAVLDHLPRIYPCDAVGVVLVEGERWRAEAIAPGEGRRARSDGPGPLPDRWLEPGDGGAITLRLGSDEDPAYLEAMRQLDVRILAALPLALRGRLMGLVLLGWKDGADRVPGPLLFATRVADQAAIALDSVRALEENRRLAHYDELTGLPNRLLFQERLEQSLVRAHRAGARTAVAMIDLDGFKRINDSLGHGSGDRLLEHLASRLDDSMRQGTIARLGGDEFTLLLHEVQRTGDVARTLQRMLEILAEPVELDGHHVVITASAGIAVFPDDGADAETLLKHADLAMYQAKDDGRNQFRFFRAEMTHASRLRLQLEESLRVALERHELTTHYQPIVEARTGRIAGAEALLRWTVPGRGSIPPERFVPVAEESGLIIPIGAWVLEQAALQAKAWRDEGRAIRIAVNVSPRQFADEDFVPLVRDVLRRTGALPRLLCLELTENLLMDNQERVLRKLAELRMIGVAVALDDFGTGYSSFSYLQHLPIDTLKLDRCFVAELRDEDPSVGIARAIVTVGHCLGTEVVAEGVETEGQERILRAMGCDYLQGFRFGRPRPASEI